MSIKKLNDQPLVVDPSLLDQMMPSPQVYQTDARGIAKRFRHVAIFAVLDVLQAEETMRFSNDHDPLPWLQQLDERYAAALTIHYQMRAPSKMMIDFTRTLAA